MKFIIYHEPYPSSDFFSKLLLAYRVNNVLEMISIYEIIKKLV